MYINGLFFFESICFSGKISEKFCVMTLKGDGKFKEKLTCGSKNNIRNLVNFYASSRKSEKFPLFMGFFCPKHIKI